MTDALAQARLGSRWTAAYVRMLLPMLRVFEDGLKSRGPTTASGAAALRFHEWRPDRHRRPPGPSSAPHDGRWAWDLLPVLSFSAWWRTVDAPAPGAVTVGLNIALDDGWPQDPDTDPDPASFPPVGECGSPITAWVYNVKRVATGVAWGDLHRALRGSRDVGSGVFDGQIHPVEAEGVEMFYRYVSADLADVPDRSSLERRLIDPVVEAFLLERRG